MKWWQQQLIVGKHISNGDLDVWLVLLEDYEMLRVYSYSGVEQTMGCISNVSKVSGMGLLCSLIWRAICVNTLDVRYDFYCGW